MWRKSKHIVCSVTSFFENRTSRDIIWKNIVQSGRPQVTQWLFRIAWYTPTATNTHSEYTILFTLPLQQCLHEHVTMLRYKYVTYLVRPLPTCLISLQPVTQSWIDNCSNRTCILIWCGNSFINLRRQEQA